VGFKTLARLLEAGHSVRCFDTRNDFPSHPKGFNEACEALLRSRGLEYEWVWGDIRDAGEEEWGSKPYPQGYYDISLSQEVLDYAHTPRSGILDNMAAAIVGVGDFLAFYRA
jgi:hypothetical protein